LRLPGATEILAIWVYNIWRKRNKYCVNITNTTHFLPSVSFPHPLVRLCVYCVGSACECSCLWVCGV
jgi:hypothetical protein